MNRTVKAILYVALIASAVVFGSKFYANYSRVMNAPMDGPSTNQPPAAPAEPLNRQPSARVGNMMAYGVVVFFTVVALGVLTAHDISRFVGHRAEKLLFNDEGEGIRNPEYEQAEAVWANGKHLEAIQLMRDYLKKNPREQHVALRIAEIYEKDLGNHLAAALEYEEVLKQKLSAERWGWAAIHLANIYSGKINKPEQAVELLRRIESEYGETAAAKKARQRLAELDGTPPEASEPEEPPSKLPPGFKPLKG